MPKSLKRIACLTLATTFVALYSGEMQTKTSLVTAETQPVSLEIVGFTLSLEDNVHMKFAVESENAERADLRVLVWETPASEYVYGTQKETLVATETEQELPVFVYEEISAREMTDVVYACAYANVNGEEYYSKPVKYSVLEYAYNKLGKTEAQPTADENLKTLLQDMLAYGASAQKYFDYKTDALATDAFTYVRMENATFSDGFSYGLFKAGTQVEISPDAGYEWSGDFPPCVLEQDGKFLLTVPQELTILSPFSSIPQTGSETFLFADEFAESTETTALTTLSKGVITLIGTQGEGNKPPTYNKEYQAVYLYGKNSITVSCPTGYVLQKVTLNFSQNVPENQLTATGGEISINGKTVVLTAQGEQTRLMINKVMSGYLRIQSVLVEYENRA